MTPFFLCPVEMSTEADAVLVSAFFVSGSPDFIILLTSKSLILLYFRLCLWRTMILLSESVASRAERAMNETIFLS